jgi:hypothetical protein
MAGTAVVGAGNYILEIDTGFIQDAFLLDDAGAGRTRQHNLRA